MLSRLRPGRNHSLVVAYLALFVALGGGAYAAGYIGSAQIINRSIKAEDVGKNQLTNREIVESTLRKVPSAAQADTARRATTADNIAHALSADRAGGLVPQRVDYRVAEGQESKRILELDGLVLSGSCVPGSGSPLLTVQSQVDNASLQVAEAYSGDRVANTAIRDFDADQLQLFGKAPEVVTIVYSQPNGANVTVTLQLLKDALASSTACLISGTALGSPAS